MSVYRDKRVSVPKMVGITINRADRNRVLYRPPMSYNKSGKNGAPITIGYICEDSARMMYPNSNYKHLFSGEWEKLFQEKPEANYKKFGIYTLFKAINNKTGILDMMDHAFGEKANAMKDFAMHSIINHSNVAAHFEADMKDYLLFSGSPYSDSTYSDIFEKRIKRPEIMKFKKEWALWCRDHGVEEIYLCIDGSNETAEAEKVEFAERGHAKTQKNKNIVSFTYAITADGLPVYMELYRGGLVDSKALLKVIDFLKGLDIKVKGVILDRGYCNANVMKYLRSLHIEYMIMVKGKPLSVHRVFEEYAGVIKLNATYWIPKTELFGMQQEVQLFPNYSHIDYLSVFFDPENAGGELKALLKKLNNEIIRLENSISSGKTSVIKDVARKILFIKDKKVCVNAEELQQAIDQKGLYSIIHSESLPVTGVNDMYNARDRCESQYMIIKSQLGFDVVRVHLTLGVHSRFLIAYIASILRYYIQKASAETGKDTNGMISEMKLIEMERYGSSYAYVHTENKRQEKLLNYLGADPTIFDVVVKEANDRSNNKIPVPRHRKPGPKKAAKRKSAKAMDLGIGTRKPGVQPGTKRSNLNKDGTPRKKPGPKKGFKRSDTRKDGTPRKKPGPKPGSHHKKT